MTNFRLATPEQADEIAGPILGKLEEKYGRLPNFFGVLGLDGASLVSFLALQEKLNATTRFTTREQELIALSVANFNGCHYCVSAHSFTAKKVAGLSTEESINAQKGESYHPREKILMTLAVNIVKDHGQLEASLIETARAQGITDADIVQITLFVALNSFTNWLNNIIDPEIDFPKVPLV